MVGMNNEVASILEETEQLTARCWHFERKYGLSTERLTHLYSLGRINDERSDIREDVAVWVGCHRAIENRRAKLRELEKDAVLLPSP